MNLFGVGAYYNEIDPYAAAWLRNLIVAGHIAPGDVDTRSILDVSPDDLRGYTQCHFFAGLGIWSLALRRAGWRDDRPIWTGSCPCQPFSVAGVGSGFDDERHVWPHFQYLIEICQPSIVAGEQVASKNADTWLDLVQDDMEGLGYAFGAVAFPSAGVGAPHIRDRTYWAGIWVADADGSAGGQGGQDVRGRLIGGDAQPWAGSGGGVLLGRLADAELSGAARLGEHGGGGAAASGVRDGSADSCLACGLEKCECECGVPGIQAGTRQGQTVVGAGVYAGGMAYPDGGNAGAEWQQRGGEQRQQPQDGGRAERLANSNCTDAAQIHQGDDSQFGERAPDGRGPILAPGLGTGSGISARPVGARRNFIGSAETLADVGRPGPTNGYWAAADWLGCRDGKWRPVEPGTFPLADGDPGRVGRVRADQERIAALVPRKDQGSRVGRLRGYGNAINAYAAQAFIESLMECLP